MRGLARSTTRAERSALREARHTAERPGRRRGKLPGDGGRGQGASRAALRPASGGSASRALRAAAPPPLRREPLSRPAWWRPARCRTGGGREQGGRGGRGSCFLRWAAVPTMPERLCRFGARCGSSSKAARAPGGIDDVQGGGGVQSARRRGGSHWQRLRIVGVARSENRGLVITILSSFPDNTCRPRASHYTLHDTAAPLRSARPVRRELLRRGCRREHPTQNTRPPVALRKRQSALVLIRGGRGSSEK